MKRRNLVHRRPSRAPVWRLLVATMVVTCGGVAPAAAESPAPAATEQQPGLMKIPLTSLEQFDQFLALRTSIEWMIRDRAADLGPDINGRTLEQNVEQFALTPAAIATTDALRAKAAAQSAAGDPTELAATLQTAEDAANDLLSRIELIGRWHESCVAIAAQEAALRAVAEKSPAAEREASRSRIDLLLADLRPYPAAALNRTPVDWPNMPLALLPELRATYKDLFTAYNEERIRLVPFAQETDAKNGIEPLGRDRATPCEGPAPSPSKTDKPALDVSTVTQPEYPAIARRLGFEGSVHIRAHVSATGCPGRVEIARSIGFAPIDEVALNWAEGLRFHPLLQDGKPSAAWHTFSATFRLTD